MSGERGKRVKGRKGKTKEIPTQTVKQNTINTTEHLIRQHHQVCQNYILQSLAQGTKNLESWKKRSISLVGKLVQNLSSLLNVS